VIFSGHPTVIGHRGSGSGVVDGHDENTLASFLAAAEGGVDWVEVDVRRTGDDGLVVRHNAAYDDGAHVADVGSAAAAARGTLGLDDLLDALPQSVGVHFDLKTCIDDALLAPEVSTVGLLARVASVEAGRRPVLVASFDPAALLAVRELAPDLATGWTTWTSFPTEHAVAAVAHLDVQVLALHQGSLRETGYEPLDNQRDLDKIVDHLHKARRQLLVWCPGGAELVRAAGAGVDAVCVDDVAASLAELGRSEGADGATG
jgi:glycerophosphoryl diester phosphodiesterase